MKVALVGAELEENLGLRYMVSMLEKQGHEAKIVPFNAENNIPQAVKKFYTLENEGSRLVFINGVQVYCLELSDEVSCRHAAVRCRRLSEAVNYS